MAKSENISMSVIKRLPRYYRFLGELEKHNITRISSRELSQRMGLTASQIRQDLNCFGATRRRKLKQPILVSAKESTSLTESPSLIAFSRLRLVSRLIL